MITLFKKVIPFLPYILIATLSFILFHHYTGLVSDNTSLRNTVETLELEVDTVEAQLTYVKNEYVLQQELNTLRDSMNTNLRELNTEISERNAQLEKELERIENEGTVTNNLNPDVGRLLDKELEYRNIE